MTTLFGVSILVTTYPEYSKQTSLCNKHNVSNLILRYPFYNLVRTGPSYSFNYGYTMNTEHDPANRVLVIIVPFFF